MLPAIRRLSAGFKPRRSELVSRKGNGVRAMSAAASPPAAFDGEMAVLYQRLFDQHLHKNGPWAMMLKEVKAALPSGTGTVLDLACGPGEPGAMVAKALPGAHVTLSDYSGDMVEKARARVAGLGNATVVQADAFNMTGMPSDHFDVVTCCYGE
ncbi:hypothetical protein FOA52_009752 [Chlamydomonas sp. UWO 241]|nr:hypothetical protein FOA52_009752 [Chlamydomonas sp. UWO 241]